MDNILELIRNEEVKWVKLGEVCTILDSKRKPISKTKRIEGIYPYYGANGIQDYVNGYIFDGTYILMGEDGSVIKKDNTPVLHWVKNSKIWVNNHAHILEEKEEKYNLRYIYYYLSTVDVSSIVRGTPPKITQANMKDIEIPIPSLELQEKIVKILDTFTLYQEKIEKELEQRKKQYEYYKDMFLSQDYLVKKAKELCGQDASLEWKKLEEVIISLNTGLNPRKFFKLNDIDSKNYYVTIKEMKNGEIVFNNNTDKINDEALLLCNKRSNLEKGDVLFSGTGTVGEVVCINETPTNWNIKEGIYVIKPNSDKLNYKFLSYFLLTNSTKDEYMKKISSGTVKSLAMKDLKQIQIPIPPLEVQEWIVNTLYPFYTISYDLNKGLPKEISLRKKQYEYYRSLIFESLIHNCL